MDLTAISDILPYIMLGGIILYQNHVFVTPVELEKKHREIMEEIEDKYTSITSFNLMEKQINQINETVTKIYEMLYK